MVPRLNLGRVEECAARRAGTARGEKNWVCGLNRTYRVGKCKPASITATGCQRMERWEEAANCSGALPNSSCTTACSAPRSVDTEPIADRGKSSLNSVKRAVFRGLLSCADIACMQ